MRSGGVLLSVHCDNARWRVRAKNVLHDTGALGIASALDRGPTSAGARSRSRVYKATA